MDERLGMRPIMRSARLQLAVKAALAAAIAWQIGQPLPGPADDYSYYAPLGAVVAMYPTVASSASAAARSLAGVGFGVGIALAAGVLAALNAFTVAGVVALGVLVGGIRGVLPFGTEARPAAARSLGRLADLASLVMEDDVLGAGVESDRLRKAVRAVADGIDDLAGRLPHGDAQTGADPFAAISVVHQLRRCLYAFEAEDLVEPVR